jgi:glycosyltransferase involved in cell wall biosynthesis
LKILAINWQDVTNPLSGGAEVHLEEILRRIALKKHQITLFCSSYPNAKKIEVIDNIKIIRKGSRYDFNLTVLNSIKSLLASEKPDLLIEDINKIPFYTPLLHNFPTLIVVPHLFADSVFKEINFVLGLYIFLSEKLIPQVYKGKKFMVISESTKKDLAGREIPAKDVTVIKCGIDHNWYQPNSSVEKEQTPLVIYVGRIKKYKSIDVLIKAFALVAEEFPQAKLAIIGDGDFLPQLKKMAGEFKLADKIEFAGFVPQREKVRWYRRAWVAACPSLKEGWGLTNIEANACGTPVVASDVPGLKDSVSNEKSGILFEYGNEKKLSEILIQIISDSHLREKLSKGGLEWAKTFSWDKAAEESLILIEKIVSEGSASGNSSSFR